LRFRWPPRFWSRVCTAKCWAIGASEMGHKIGPRSVRGGALEASETRFGHGSFGCTFLVPQVWQKLVLIRGDDGMIDRTLLAPTAAKKNNKNTRGNQALAVPSHTRKRSASRTA
jgi:hypothetical protein